MSEEFVIRPIARMRSDFEEKFGIPRQSGLVPALRSTVVFEPAYRSEDALRGLEEYSHLWLLWQFSKALREGWSPTVRPPRLGGNARMGVFATRSPFRPNPIGLSCVRLEGIGHDRVLGPVLYVSGADLLDGTPIYDLKPYLPYADAVPDARGGFTDRVARAELEVRCEERLLAALPPERRAGLLGALAQDPRPSYQDDPARVYGMRFAGREVRFSVAGRVLTVHSVD